MTNKPPLRPGKRILETVPIDSLILPVKSRHSEDAIKALAESIRTLGVMYPPIANTEGRLLAGDGRVRALKSLGKTKVRIFRVVADSLRDQLISIDENLTRTELTHLERAEQLQLRKDVYEELNPQAKRGGLPGKPGGGKVKAAGPVGFVVDTANKTGQSATNIKESLVIANKLSPEVKDSIRGTPLADQKTSLLNLARQPKEFQKEILEKLSTGQLDAVPTPKRRVREDTIPSLIAGSYKVSSKRQLLAMTVLSRALGILADIFDESNDSVRWDDLAEGALSGGERAFLSWSYCIWTDKSPPSGWRDPFEGFSVMDKDLQIAVISALKVRHGIGD